MQLKEVEFDLVYLILVQQAKPHAQTSKTVTCDQDEQYVGHMIVLDSFVLFCQKGDSK